MCVQGPQWPEGIEALRTRVTDGCEQPELCAGTVAEQPELFTPEPVPTPTLITVLSIFTTPGN